MFTIVKQHRPTEKFSTYQVVESEVVDREMLESDKVIGAPEYIGEFETVSDAESYLVDLGIPKNTMIRFFLPEGEVHGERYWLGPLRTFVFVPDSLDSAQKNE